MSEKELPPSEKTRPRATSPMQAFLYRVQDKYPILFGTVLAQAEAGMVDGNLVMFKFADDHQVLADRFQKCRPNLEQVALEVFGREMTVLGDTSQQLMPWRAW